MKKNKHTMYNKYLLLGAYRSDVKVETIENSGGTKKMKKPLQWFSKGILLVEASLQ